jgi:hypothetical protein
VTRPDRHTNTPEDAAAAERDRHEGSWVRIAGQWYESGDVPDREDVDDFTEVGW